VSSASEVHVPPRKLRRLLKGSALQMEASNNPLHAHLLTDASIITKLQTKGRKRSLDRDVPSHDQLGLHLESLEKSFSTSGSDFSLNGEESEDGNTREAATVPSNRPEARSGKTIFFSYTL
jgi:hypothetical protein